MDDNDFPGTSGSNPRFPRTIHNDAEPGRQETPDLPAPHNDPELDTGSRSGRGRLVVHERSYDYSRTMGSAGGLGLTQTADYTPPEIPGVSVDYQKSLEEIAPNITEIIAQQQAQGESWPDALSRLLPILASTYQQKQLLDVQVQRAKAGLPALDASQYAGGVKIGLSSDVQRLLIYGGIAGVALVMLGILRPR